MKHRFLAGEANIAKLPEIRKKISDNKWQGHTIICIQCGITIRCSAYKLKTKKYCSRHCQHKHMSTVTGKDAPNWRGGKRMFRGYTMIYSPDHPAVRGDSVPEHRLIMEQYLGRYLTSDEIVHHKNEIKSDNRLQNLHLTNRAGHRTLHRKNRLCSIVGCGRRHQAKGFCSIHYKRNLRASHRPPLVN